MEAIETSNGQTDGEINKNSDKTDDNTNETNNEDNTEDNDEENEENVDIFSLLYGTEEDRDEEECEENEAIDENEGSIGDMKPKVVNQIEGQNQSSDSLSESVPNSCKRRSTETDSNQSKRIKAEPKSPNRADRSLNESKHTTGQRLTTTCEAVEVDEEEAEEQTSIDIPKNTSEFMSFLLDLNVNDLESKDLNQLSVFDKLPNVSNCLTFDGLESLRNAFIPYILWDLCRKIKRQYINSTNAKESKHFYSILTKSMSNRMQKGLEMKCISVIKPKSSPTFRFGQLVTIQTAVQPKPNSTTHMITRKKYLGYVTSHLIRAFNSENQSEVNHLRLVSEHKRESILVEEIGFMTKYADEIYMRNDALIVAQPIICIHNSHLEARAVFKFDQFPIASQILNPIYTSRASGVSVNIQSKRFDENLKECIQTAMDVVANNSLSNSSFFAINGTKGSEKTSILIEIMRQIVGSESFKTTKVLFTSGEDNCLKSVLQILKSNRIKVYSVESNTNIDTNFKKTAIKQIQHRMAKDTEEQRKELYEQCIEYFETNMETDLSIESTLIKNSIIENSKQELMAQSSVIVGRIDDLCNDIAFYKHFSPNPLFSCCLIDDSDAITEPQLYSLFWFGIKKFILSADFVDSDSVGNDSDICRRYGLSRSFFERYFLNRPDSQSTIFQI